MRTFTLLAAYWFAVLLATAASGIGNYTIYHDWLSATAVSLAVCAIGVLVGVIGLLLYWSHPS